MPTTTTSSAPASITAMQRVISAALLVIMAFTMFPATTCAPADIDASTNAGADVSAAKLARRDIDWANSKPYDGSVWDGTRWIAPHSDRDRGSLDRGIEQTHSKPNDAIVWDGARWVTSHSGRDHESLDSGVERANSKPGIVWDGTRWVTSHSDHERGSLQRSGWDGSPGESKSRDVENQTHEIQEHGSGDHGRGLDRSNGWGRVEGHGRSGHSGRHGKSHSSYGASHSKSHGTYGASHGGYSASHSTYRASRTYSSHHIAINTDANAAPIEVAMTDIDTAPTATVTGTQSMEMATAEPSPWQQGLRHW
ncbi:hypothetical protein GGF31_007094 [Allomyces arbusculus]|nr:hypothetical protein GGF31_007094 [Allomyces arbusculus]